jgi:type II secretory pathway predicted ATPase ExeA
MRPVLIIDEAQETPTNVLSELRILSSKDFDARQLLCVVFAGDSRLPERLRSAELLPLGSRIRRRLVLDYASRDELCACLDHLLDVAGNPSLMTPELKTTLVDHAAGNYRVMMNLADELLAVALDRDLPRLDEKLYLEVFGQPQKPKAAARKR